MEILFFVTCALAVLMPLFFAWQSHEFEVALLKDNITKLEAKIERMSKKQSKSKRK
jgi:hypothetical protein